MIVFDSATLILLAKIDLLDLIVARSSVQLAIPEEVKRECCLETRTLDALLIRKRIDEAKIRTIAVKRKRVAKELAADFSLGSGEAAAIALALEQRAQLVAIDDKNVINACKLVKLAFTTAIAMLVEGAAKG